MTEEGDARQILGELLEGQKTRGKQLDRVEAKMDALQICHQKTRDMVIQHRTGWKMLAWLGGIGLAVLAAINSGHFGK